ncbi:hypothetical protein [Psychroserpens sp. MEBiC05023]
MKKFMIALCCVALVFTSCNSSDDDGGGDDDGLTCSEATQNTLMALASLNNGDENDYEALCNAYKITLEQQIEACGDPNGTIQGVIDDLDDCEVSNNQSNN